MPAMALSAGPASADAVRPLAAKRAYGAGMTRSVSMVVVISPPMTTVVSSF